MPLKIGYARVSTAEQNLDLQVSALKGAGCHPILTDQGVSGCQRDRPQFDNALNMVESGDTLLIWRLDRMSRSLKHLIEISELLKARGAFFESLTEKIDTSSAMGEFVFHILGAVAQLEREIIRERTMAGLAEAARKGRYPGRPPKLRQDRVLEAHHLVTKGGQAIEHVASEYDVSPITMHRAFERYGLDDANLSAGRCDVYPGDKKDPPTLSTKRFR